MQKAVRVSILLLWPIVPNPYVHSFEDLAERTCIGEAGGMVFIRLPLPPSRVGISVVDLLPFSSSSANVSGLTRCFVLVLLTHC